MNQGAIKLLAVTNPIAWVVGTGALSGIILRRLYLALAKGVVKDIRRILE